MAAVTLAKANDNTNNVNSIAPVPFTPAAGALLFAFVAVTGDASTDWQVTDDLDGAGWTRVGPRRHKNSSADFQECWVRDDFVIAASMSVTWSSATATTMSGLNIRVLQVTGLTRTGLSAVRQYNGQDNHAAATPAPAFSAAVLTANPVIGSFHNATSPFAATNVAPTGFTQQTNNGYSVPTTGMVQIRRDSGFTGTTITLAAASATEFSSIIIEVDTSSAALTLDADAGSIVIAGGLAAFTGAGRSRLLVGEQLTQGDTNVTDTSAFFNAMDCYAESVVNFGPSDPQLAKHITAVSHSGSLVTFTVAGHGWSVGQHITTFGFTDSRYNSEDTTPNPVKWVITARTTDTFTVDIGGSAPANYTSFAVVTNSSGTVIGREMVVNTDVYAWSSLDTRVDRMRLGCADGQGSWGLIATEAPRWMRPGQDTDGTVGIDSGHFQDYADFIGIAFARYQPLARGGVHPGTGLASDPPEFCVVWNEMKGMYDNANHHWDYVSYTTMYNLVYAAVKAVDSTILVGGPYPELGAYSNSSAITPSHHDLVGGPGAASLNQNATWGAIDAQDTDVIVYWALHATGFDFVCYDGHAQAKDTNLINGSTAAQKASNTAAYWHDLATFIAAIPGCEDKPQWIMELHVGEKHSPHLSDADQATMYSSALQGLASVGGIPIRAFLWGLTSTSTDANPDIDGNGVVTVSGSTVTNTPSGTAILSYATQYPNLLVSAGSVVIAGGQASFNPGAPQNLTLQAVAGAITIAGSADLILPLAFAANAGHVVVAGGSASFVTVPVSLAVPSIRRTVGAGRRIRKAAGIATKLTKKGGI